MDTGCLEKEEGKLMRGKERERNPKGTEYSELFF